jgi:8-oxo-dGTP diphosphatase
MERNASGELPRPKVGVGVLIQNEKEEVLLGLRKSSHGAGEWSFPGGHLEFGETLFETAKREVKEETDLDVHEFELISVADEMRYIESDAKHYLNIGIRATYEGGEPKVMEPTKCDQWKWFRLDDLPRPIFEGTASTLRNFNDKKIYQPEKEAS